MGMGANGSSILAVELLGIAAKMSWSEVPGGGGCYKNENWMMTQQNRN